MLSGKKEPSLVKTSFERCPLSNATYKIVENLKEKLSLNVAITSMFVVRVAKVLLGHT